MSQPGGKFDLIRGPEDFARTFGVSRQVTDRLAIYEGLLRQWQKTINLVAPSTLDDIWHRHFADSAQLLALAPQARTWVDLGSGAGFPGLVVAILMAESAREGAPSSLAGQGQGGGYARSSDLEITPTPNPSPQGGGGPVARGETQCPHLTLIESNARKCAFLREVVRQTGIGPLVTVDILSTRIELATTQASLAGPEVLTARALAPLERLLGLAAPLFAPWTIGLFLKGQDAGAERERAEKMWNFKAELIPSRTEAGAYIVAVRHLEARGKNKGQTP